MGKTLSAKMDMGDFGKRLDHLKGAGRESLARRMLVSGGVILRDEARQNARISHAKTSWIPNPKSRGSDTPGQLATAIYLARNEKLSNQTVFTYSVSWNAKLAWWGKLREFGYTMRYAVYKDANGVWHTNKKLPLAEPRRMPAHPILAPAFDQNIMRVREAMIARGKEELPKILQGGGDGT